MAYTPEQYAAAGQFIQQNLGNPELIASTASSFGLSVDDLLKASQTVDPNLTAQDVTGYFQRSGIDYSPVTTASPLEQAKSYWTQQTGDTSYGGLTDADIGAYIQANPTTYQSSLQQMAQNYQPQSALSTLTPTTDVSLTSSGTGKVAPLGSLAYQQFTAPGGAGLTEMNRIISDYLGTSPTEADVYKRMRQFGVSPEDIERASGKTLDMLYPEVFRPGSVLSSGFGDVTKQLGGSGYYKGVAVPTFYDQSLGDAGYDYAADQLARWKANIDKQDLSARAPFGFVETPVYTQQTGDYDPYISGYQSTPATALDYLTKNNPVISNAIYGHTSTDARAYKVVNGQLQEVGQDQITPEDIAEGNAFFMLAGKTGGPNRERMAQLYRADGDNLIPVGDPKMYKGAVKQDMGLAFLDMAASALSFVPGPWQIPAVAYKAVRGAMEGDWTGVAKAFLPPGVATAVSVYEAFDSKDPFRIATALMGTDVLPEIGSFDLGAGVTVKDAVLAAKAVEAINNGQWDVAAIIGGQLSGSSELTAAGQGLRIKNAIERGDYMGAMSAVQGLNSTINKLSTAPPNLLNEIAFQEANASPLGLSALSPIAAEDEQIAIQQRQNAANQALTDYMGPGNDLSREGLVSQLKNLGLTADQAEGYAKKADQQINMNRIGADVMSRYSKIDPEFGTPQLDRDTATQELVAAGFTSDRANEILNGIDAQNAIKLENRLSVQSAYQNFTQGKGSEDQLRSALTSAGYSDAQINELVTRGRGVIAGSQLTGGEQAQERASLLPDIRGEIAAKSNFNDAYALAREKLGAGATFTWQGKDYVASSAAERPDLTGTKTGASTSTATTDVPYIAPNGMHNRAAFIQAGGGTSDADYAKYVQAVNAVIAEGKSGTLITPASVNSTGKEMPSTTGPVTMEKPRVDSVLGSVAAQGVASFGANSIAGVLNSLGFTDAGKTVLDKANQIAAAATAAEGADITKGKADINAAIKKVGESSGIKDFAVNVGNLASTAFNNPKAFGATVGSEVVEELLQLATLKFPGSFLVKETVASALENGGAAYNTEYESQIAKGASKEDAHLAAQKAAGTAAGVTVALAGGAAGLGKVAGKVIGSQVDEVPTSGVGQVGKTTLKESAQETVEEGSIAGAIDLALGRPVDAVNVLTNMTGGALYGGPTSGVMQATKLDTLDQAASTSIGSGLNADSISASIKSGAPIDTTVKSALDAGADTTVVVGAAINSALDTGMSTGTVISSTVGSAVSSGADSTIVIDSALSAVAKSGGDVSQAAGSAVTASLNAGANPNETIIAATNSAIKNGSDVGSAVTTVIAGAVQGGASLSDASASSVATAIVSGADPNAVVKAVTDSNNNVSVKADTSNNVTTVVASDATSDTKVVMDSNSQSVVTTSTDTNTGTTTQTTMQGNTTTTTTTNQNTGISTTTKVDPNTTTNTTIDTNTGITTQVTTNTDTNTNSTTTVDTNTNTTTNTTTNNNTNTTTNTSVNTDTGDVVITVVDDKTGEVIDTKITTIDQLPTDVKETLTVDITTGTTTDKTTTTKASAVTMPKAATAGAGMSLIGDIGRLPGTMLKTAGDPTLKDPLSALSQKVEEMNQIDPALLAVMAQRLGMQMPQAPQEPTFTYGQETSIDDILGLREPKAPEEEETAFAEGGFVEPLRAKAMNPQFMNHGGALPGGRENFKDGKHVAGEGDGQSDDIPAWLADGEFVFPADVVSALGNGSTKAGTDKLYKMMHEIRARARSTKVKDLPPPAHKSPLDYLKRGK